MQKFRVKTYSWQGIMSLRFESEVSFKHHEVFWFNEALSLFGIKIPSELEIADIVGGSPGG